MAKHKFTGKDISKQDEEDYRKYGMLYAKIVRRNLVRVDPLEEWCVRTRYGKEQD